MANPLDGNGAALKRELEMAVEPCPFCGGEATVHNYPNVTSGRDWFVHCPACDMSLDAFGTRDEAVARWNRRAPPAPSHTAVEPVAELAAFLDEAARYFEKRDTGGEDMAFWANVVNAENCRKAASTLTAQAATVATLKARVAELEAGLEDVFRLNDECSGSEPSISVLMRAIDDLRARHLTHQEKNNGR